MARARAPALPPLVRSRGPACRSGTSISCMRIGFRPRCLRSRRGSRSSCSSGGRTSSSPARSVGGPLAGAARASRALPVDGACGCGTGARSARGSRRAERRRTSRGRRSAGGSAARLLRRPALRGEGGRSISSRRRTGCRGSSSGTDRCETAFRRRSDSSAPSALGATTSAPRSSRARRAARATASSRVKRCPTAALSSRPPSGGSSTPSKTASPACSSLRGTRPRCGPRSSACSATPSSAIVSAGRRGRRRRGELLVGGCYRSDDRRIPRCAAQRALTRSLSSSRDRARSPRRGGGALRATSPRTWSGRTGSLG